MVALHIVCCFLCSVFATISHSLDDGLPWTWSEVQNHPAWNYLDTFDCGFSVSDRIIGGVNAALGQYPWIVRIGYTADPEHELDWLCGGALITDRHVITAAHCVQTASEGYKLSKVRIGEYNTETNPDCQLAVCAPPYQDRKVKRKILHPNFNNPPFQNDIAILLLDRPVQISDYVSPICLPREQLLADLKIGELLTVAGWGKMNMTTEERAKILQFVSVPVVRADTCEVFRKGLKLAQSSICAGAQLNKDACGGDSGGPLMKVFDTVDGPKDYLMGVVSFGPTICGIRRPGVYASVRYFIYWILNNIL
ncbi:CLIP domain-containing serine protease HP8-like isoform X2 [Leptidea sinapis]|uniref:CLIP domain-containing serine protease HP8-like isoform X2 n=1 Tax=Leptidea sinapis TaxID=189913 RepID=UPI0021C42D7B|nr:CLIP domain-containing serine protease HP8-like isoform X2 [Leptidea sinapis]